MRIGDLPFHEKPILELLALEEDHDVDDLREYAGFGWTLAPEIWLNDELVTDALVVAVHADDHGERQASDIELAFELPDLNVTMLLSAFLRVWLPKLPSASTIVLAVCNPFNAILTPAGPPLRYPMGKTTARFEPDLVPPIGLQADTWCTLGP